MSPSNSNGLVTLNGYAVSRNGQTKHRNWTKENFLFSSERCCWYKAETILGAKITVRKLSLNVFDNEKIHNDIRKTIRFGNDGITSVLKFIECENDGQHYNILYENFITNLSNFIDNHIQNLNFENFMDISTSIIEAIGLIHSKKIVLKNVSSSNMAYCLDNNKPRIKIFNLENAEEVSNEFASAYINDIKEVGKIFLSFVVDRKNLDQMLREIESKTQFEECVQFLCNNFKHVAFIEPYRKKSFAHLIVRLLKTTESSIEEFENHRFFSTGPQIERMLRVINTCVDKSSGAKDADLIKQLNQKLGFNEKNTWKSKLDKEVADSVQGKFLPSGCELIRFFRNKVAHRDDLDDAVNSFFVNKRGVLKYFFETFDDLYYILSSFCEDNRLYEKPMKVATEPKVNPENNIVTNPEPPQPSSSRNVHPVKSYRNVDMNNFTSNENKNKQINNTEQINIKIEYKLSENKSKNNKNSGNYKGQNKQKTNGTKQQGRGNNF